MEFKYIIAEFDEPIARIRLNRPKVLNALSDEVFSELHEAFKIIDKNHKIRVLILSGEGGKAFAAGADIINMMEQTSIGIRPMVEESLKALHLLETMPCVSIAVINGYALGGGCELAMSCDLRVAGKSAQFGLPETGLGIIPGSGGTQRMPRLIGMAKAKELIFTGDFIDGTEAERLGLVNKVTEDDKTMEEAEKMAAKILKKGPMAIRAAKDSIVSGIQLDMENALKYELNNFASLFATKDQKEGMRAFSEKRKPVYIDE